MLFQGLAKLSPEDQLTRPINTVKLLLDQFYPFSYRPTEMVTPIVDMFLQEDLDAHDYDQ
jgi:hypothetical protein